MQQLTRWEGPNKSNENETCKKTAGLILVTFEFYKKKVTFRPDIEKGQLFL